MPPKRFSCAQCGTKCITKSKLEQHEKQHVLTLGKSANKTRGKQEQKCKTCPEVFTSVVLLKKHQIFCGKSTKCKLVSKLKCRPELEIIDNKVAVQSVKQKKKTKEDALRAQMFTKVQFLLDGTKGPEKTLSSNNSIANSQPPKACSALSANGIQNMTLSLQNSMNSLSSKASKVSRKTPLKSGKINNITSVSRASPRSSVAKASKLNIPASEELLPKKRLRKTLINKTQIQSSVSNKRNCVQKENNTEQTVKNATRRIAKEPAVITKKGRGRKASPLRIISKNSSKKTSPNAKLISKKSKVISQQKQKDVEEVDDLEDDEEDESEDNYFSDEDAEYVPKNHQKEKVLEKYSSGSAKQDDDDEEEEEEVRASDSQSKQFTCALCLKTFSRKYHLDRHLKLSPCSGLPPPSFPCQVCNRVYTRKDNLREHLRAHTGEAHRKKKHKCQFCNKAFHGQSLLTIHVRKHTGEKPYTCDFCPKKFPSAGALAKHRRTHTGEKPFSCPDCGHRFSLKGTLNRHLRVHTGVRPHKCVYCGKQFIQIGGLKAHLFYHTGENGFKCEDCGKVFNRKARLQMHKLYVHVKLRPFLCENCPKSFTRKEDLNRHAILHTGEKPFKCPTCNKSFAIKPSLKLHLLTHTKEEPRSCHECGRAFIRKDCLLRHMRKRHRDLLDKILLDEKDEKFPGETSAVSSRMLNEEDLCENIHELLSLLVDEPTLIGFGWPHKPVDEVLESVIRRCGHTPVSPDQYSYMDRMRENAKLLFTVVIDDNAVKTLLNNQTVDEVILHVLRLAKT